MRQHVPLIVHCTVHVVVCCLVCLLTMLNRRYTVRHYTIRHYTIKCYMIRRYTMSIRMILLRRIVGLPLQQLDSIRYGDHECMMDFTAPL